MTATLPPWVGHVSIPNSAWKDGIVPYGHICGKKPQPVRQRMKPREIRSHRDPRRRVSIPELLAAGFGGFVVGAGFLWFVEVVVRHG